MARKEKQKRNTGPKETHPHKQHRNRRSFDPNQPENDVDQTRDDHAEELKPVGGNEKSFNILVDSVPYMIKAVSFSFNGEPRYRVSFNGSPEHVFTWDSSLGQLRAINDDSSTIPDNLEIAISEKLQSKT
jgi:hypothetical protein